MCQNVANFHWSVQKRSKLPIVSVQGVKIAKLSSVVGGGEWVDCVLSDGECMYVQVKEG
jgi:hypothetical protein